MRNLKSLRTLSGAMVLGVLLAACQGESPTAPSSELPKVVRPDQMVDAIVAMGFARDAIVDRGDHFVVEGDVIIQKASLQASLDSGRMVPEKPRYQYSTTFHPDLSTWELYNYAPHISVDLSAVQAESPAWATAVRGAIDNWHSIPGAQVTFIEAPGYEYSVTVVRGTCDSDPRTIACARFPTQQCDWLACHGVPGTQITITRNHDDLTDAEKLFTVTHEMGHIVGFRHTNWNNRLCGSYPNYYACSEGDSANAIHIPGTPTSILGGPQGDPLSIMNATVLPWNGFTLYDRIAARYLFPGGPGPSPTLSLTNPTPELSWTPMQDAVAYEIWYAQPQGCGSVICFGPNPPDIMTYVGTTSATSYLDGSRTRAGVCTAPDYFTPVAAYRIKALFPDNGRKTDLSAYTSCW